MKRVFISIDIPLNIKEKIKKIQDILPELNGKKIEEENLHLTLKFLGNLPDKKIGIVKEKLNEIDFRKFESEIDGIGFFSEKFIRIVWLHLSNCEELQKEIDFRLSGLFEKEQRFMCHLTIARIKSIKDGKEFISELKKIKFSKMKFLVDNFKLKESILAEDKPTYKTLAEYLLREY